VREKLMFVLIGVVVDRLWTTMQRVTWTPLWNRLWRKPRERRQLHATLAKKNEQARNLHRALIGRRYLYRDFDDLETTWQVIDVVQTMYVPFVHLQCLHTSAQRQISVAELDPYYTLHVLDSYTMFIADDPDSRYSHIPLPSDHSFCAFPSTGERARQAREVTTPEGLLSYAVDGISTGPSRPLRQPTIGDCLMEGKIIARNEGEKWLIRLGRFDLHHGRCEEWTPEIGYCQHAEPTKACCPNPRPPES